MITIEALDREVYEHEASLAKEKNTLQRYIYSTYKIDV
jgi:hypothetical protein